MKKLYVFLIFLWLVTTSSLFAQPPQTAIIGFYNLENLFDTINDPAINDEEFLPDGDVRWTSQRYLTKLDRMSEVIAAMASLKGGLPVLGVSEVENQQVLLDLVANKRLRPFHFSVCHHDSPDRRGIDVAFLYQPDRFQIIGTKAFPLRIPDNPDFITRDQWLMSGILDNYDTLHIIVNHWPSKRGGEKRSMPYRNAAAALCRHIADSLMQTSPHVNVIIMGDLNDNPNAKSIMETLGTKTNVKSVGERDLFNPMWKLYRDGIGSYVYRDTWELIDNIIVSGNLVRATSPHYHFDSAHIFRKNFMITHTGSFTGYPYRTYAGGIYHGGYSDHLPIYIILNR